MNDMIKLAIYKTRTADVSYNYSLY